MSNIQRKTCHESHSFCMFSVVDSAEFMYLLCSSQNKPVKSTKAEICCSAHINMQSKTICSIEASEIRHLSNQLKLWIVKYRNFFQNQVNTQMILSFSHLQTFKNYSQRWEWAIIMTLTFEFNHVSVIEGLVHKAADWQLKLSRSQHF